MGEQDRMLDSLTLSVIANRVDAIVREMSNTLLRSGRSTVIASVRDFSCTVVTADNRLLTATDGIPVHVLGSHIQTRSMCDLHDDLAEGDAFLHNDPYLGNTHAADHTILIPVFVDGEHLFTTCAKSHQADIGNSVAVDLSCLGQGRIRGRRLDLPVRAGAARLRNDRRHHPHMPRPDSGTRPMVRRFPGNAGRGPDRRAGAQGTVRQIRRSHDQSVHRAVAGLFRAAHRAGDPQAAQGARGGVGHPRSGPTAAARQHSDQCRHRYRSRSGLYRRRPHRQHRQCSLRTQPVRGVRPQPCVDRRPQLSRGRAGNAAHAGSFRRVRIRIREAAPSASRNSPFRARWPPPTSANV